MAEQLLGQLENSAVNQRFANFCFREQHGLVESYSAWDNCLDRPIIFKIFRRNIIEKRDRLARLEEEVRNLATVISPHVVRILDFGKTKDVAYLAVDWVDGTPLLECKEHCGLEPHEVCTLIAQAAEGLAAASEAGVLHRNIRASSILVTQEGFAKVTDFAVAMFVGPSEMPKVTRSGYFMGSTHNAAPELYAGERTSPITETFALGCVFYKALTGVAPYSDEVVTGFSVGELPKNPAYAPSSLDAKIDKSLDDIVLSAIAISPTQRIQSISLLRDRLNLWLSKQQEKRRLSEVTEKGEVERIATATKTRTRKRKRKEKKIAPEPDDFPSPPKEAAEAEPSLSQERAEGAQKLRTGLFILFLVILSYIAGAMRQSRVNDVPEGKDGAARIIDKANPKIPPELSIYSEPYDCPPPLGSQRATTILLRAIWKGSQKDVDLLLRGGAFVDGQDAFGRSALFLAAQQGSLSIVNLLLKNSADVKLEDKAGRQALHMASLRGHLAIVNLLVRKGALVDCQSKQGLTPLHYACAAGRLTVARSLIKKGADVNMADGKKLRPLHRAAAIGSLDLVNLLLNNGATAGLQDDKSLRPFDYAVDNGYEQVAHYLKRHGTD